MAIVKREPTPPPRSVCAKMREARYDMTEYVVHMTWSLDSLIEILREGYIRASLSEMGNIYSTKVKPTIRGPRPAVCFTEQPLWALIDTVNATGGRWSGYGVAFHKVPLYRWGARPVWYVPLCDLGSEVGKAHKNYKEGRRIHGGNIPLDLQYRCVPYEPDYSYTHMQQIDFSWEREWRFVSKTDKLPLIVGGSKSPLVIIVREDKDTSEVRTIVNGLADDGVTWAEKRIRIISLERAERRLEETGDRKYGRIETWPYAVIPRKKKTLKVKKAKAK